MKHISRNSFQVFIHAILLVALFAVTVHAHDTWITMESYYLDKSKSASFTVANAHKFVIPGEKPLAADQVQKAFFLGPDGKESAAIVEGNDKFISKTALKAEGSYLAVVKKEGGFATKTVDGIKRGKSKKDVKDAVECTFSEKYAKALFILGKAGGAAVLQPIGQPFEIVPLKDPATLKKGDELPVKVLLEGKPARTIVFGTYAGFSPEANTFAYTTATDKEGVANIRLLSNGPWLLVAKQGDMAYPDATVCDKKAYAATLTFQIQ